MSVLQCRVSKPTVADVGVVYHSGMVTFALQDVPVAYCTFGVLSEAVVALVKNYDAAAGGGFQTAHGARIISVSAGEVASLLDTNVRNSIHLESVSSPSSSMVSRSVPQRVMLRERGVSLSSTVDSQTRLSDCLQFSSGSSAADDLAKRSNVCATLHLYFVSDASAALQRIQGSSSAAVSTKVSPRLPSDSIDAAAAARKSSSASAADPTENFDMPVIPVVRSDAATASLAPAVQRPLQSSLTSSPPPRYGLSLEEYSTHEAYQRTADAVAAEWYSASRWVPHKNSSSPRVHHVSIDADSITAPHLTATTFLHNTAAARESVSPRRFLPQHQQRQRVISVQLDD